MTNPQEQPLTRLDTMVDGAIEKCNTHSYRAKDIAKDLRANGFDGHLTADLIKECELALKFAHLYQAYINCLEE